MFLFSDEEKLLNIVKRERQLFQKDLLISNKILENEIKNSTFLVIGGAGSIGSAVVKEIFVRNPKKLHVVDINENGLAELVRDIRSSYGYIEGEFKTFILDVLSDVFDKFFEANKPYDYILNFSALKHVRSEKDPFTLMRMIDVNIFATIKTLELARKTNAKKYFCVSTDKATNPVNMMGASKRIMEHFLLKYSEWQTVSTARFANVAFSQGSLLESWIFRLQKGQPIVAPKNIRRYFVTQKESGILCLMSIILGENREIFFPKLSEENLIPLTEVALRFVEIAGYQPVVFESEEESRKYATILPDEGKYACYFSESDTTGEKEYEEFFTENEEINLDRFRDIGIVKLKLDINEEKLESFERTIKHLKTTGWTKKDLVELFEALLPDFKLLERGKYLDDKM